MKAVRFHLKALGFVREQSTGIRQQIGEALRNLQRGLSLGMPLSRPMPTVGPGVHELRVKDASSVVRVFYIVRTADAIWVFHAFTKKSEKTPSSEVELGRKRFREVQMAKRKAKKAIQVTSAADLGRTLGLSASETAEMEFRSELTVAIAKIIRGGTLTHGQIATASGTSRTRVTAIANGNTAGISTDVLIRVLAATGYRAQLRVRRAIAA